jgi:hypothetical protein
MTRYQEPRDPEGDEIFFLDDEEENVEPYDPSGGGRVHSSIDVTDGSGWGEDESGHAWQQYFHDPVREPYGGSGGAGELVPYGGRRFAYGRESSAAREDGQLYGRDVRNFGHRRDTFYARADATPWWETPADEPEAPPPFGGNGTEGAQRPDQRIEQEVVQRLADAGWVDASDVEVEVSDGVVTLRGDVEARAERRAAEEIASEVAGVVDVVNELRPRNGRRDPRA